jgi:hypothetical protein
LQGERLSVQLSGTTPDQLASWLRQARESAQALPVQAQLKQASAETTTPNPSSKTPQAPREPDAAGNPVRWNGSLLLSLP